MELRTVHRIGLVRAVGQNEGRPMALSLKHKG
jgi:hypothetical protein